MSSEVDRRRDKQVWEALDANNFRQALQLCEKRLKKGEKSDNLLALRAHVLLTSPSASQQEQGVTEFERLCAKEPPVTDLHTLSMIQQALGGSNARKSVLKGRRSVNVALLWERAAKFRSGDESLPKEWFMITFELNQWVDAQKAAMFLQRFFPKNRDYYFWAILMCHLIYLSPEASDSDRKLFGTLAYRMISKAASEVPTDSKILLSPGRAVQTPDELQLLISIYRKQGYFKEALSILDSENLGIFSPVAKGDWSFVREKLEILGIQNLWQEKWEFCKKLLDDVWRRRYEAGNETSSSNTFVRDDDLRLWQGMLLASKHIQTGENSAATEKTIQAYLCAPKASRNSQLAFLQFMHQQTVARGVSDGACSSLLTACQDYFETHSVKLCCFDDLRLHVEQLNDPQRVELLSSASKHVESLEIDGTPDVQASKLRKLYSEINLFKLEYLINFSADNQDVTQQGFELFITACIRVYKDSLPLGSHLLPTDNQPGDDVCILAVMALVRLAEMKSGPADAKLCMIQAAALLDFLLSQSQHNYQARLLSVRLHMILGTGSLAMQRYAELQVKQIQHDTVSYNFFTRLSTIHPHSITTTANAGSQLAFTDPDAYLRNALRLYRIAQPEVPEMMKLALNKGTYCQIEGFQEFDRRLNGSICKPMWALERRRIARLFSSDRQDQDLDLIESIPPAFRDNRDFHTMINLEASGVPRFEDHVKVGPTPNSRWLGSLLWLDDTMSRLASTSPVKDARDTASRLLDSRDPGKLADEMTGCEIEALHLQTHLEETLSAVTQSNPTDVGLSHVQQWIEDKLGAIRVDFENDRLEQLKLDNRQSTLTLLDWVFFHASFTCLESVKTISMLVDYLSKTKVGKSKSVKVEMARIKDLVSETYQEVRSQAVQVKNSLSESGVVGFLVVQISGKESGKNSLGAAIQDLVGEPWMEIFLSKLIESWQEALEGIFRVKLK
ncbi:MAG: hypothetical protein M1819_002252 [Sarea resinae]|nr:MAG: hypothetical protein M1819_002252 [Sarea resinae]